MRGSQRRGSLLPRILIALVSTAVSLVVADRLCGVLLSNRGEAIPGGEAGIDMVAGLIRGVDENPTPLREDADLLWRNAESTRRKIAVNPRHFGHRDRWTVEINSRGFRGPELAPSSNATYRILCIGDSTTFGYNVDQPATFTIRLEKRLEERFPGRSFEVINAGVPGWSWIQGLRFLDLEGRDLRPNLVIAALGTNDRAWEVTVTDEERTRTLAAADSDGFRSFERALRQTSLYRAALLLFPRPAEGVASPGCRDQHDEICRRVSLPEIEAAVAGFQRISREIGAELLLLDLDFLELGGVRASSAAAQRLGIPFVDLVAQFNDERRKAAHRTEAEMGLAPSSPDEEAHARDRPASSSHRAVLLRVLVEQACSAIAVDGSSEPGGAFKFHEVMFDDGTHGDEIANDGVFTVWLEVPESVATIKYKFIVDGVPEFKSMGMIGSLRGNRLTRVDGEVIAPIARLGELFWMVERTHPDAQGHAAIAERLLVEVERFQSFRDFVGDRPGVGVE